MGVLRVVLVARVRDTMVIANAVSSNEIHTC